MGQADKDEFLRIIDEAETERFGAPEGERPRMQRRMQKQAPPPVTRVLAVTACPTGIAHTYLAAEALQRAAQTRGFSIKVETNGADG